MTPARAWTIAVPRAAEDVLAVQASVLKVDEERVVRDSLPDLASEHALLTMLEGPEDRFGVAIIDATVLASLIEAATVGRVGSRPVTPRPPTRTDATICADVLDAVLDGFESNLSEMEDPPNLGGYRYAAPIVDARAMTMTLADGPYSVFRLSLDLGGGLRQGEIVVAFPVAPRGAARGADVAAFQRALADNVMEAPAELDAALHRVRMPLSEIVGLQAGDVLHVPLGALGAVDVEVPGGPLVARARLGQQGGFRAVRITQVEGAGAVPEAESLDFQDAAPAASRAALPLAGIGDAEGSAHLADLGDADLPSMDDLPDLDGAETGELPPLGGETDGEVPDLPPLGDEGGPELPELPAADEDEEGLPDSPGLPPLSG